MNSTASLPSALQAKLARLERRIRAARLLGGLAGVVIGLTGLFLAMCLLEVAVGWSVFGLRGANASLLAVTIAGAGAMFLIYRRSLPWSRLAALVERRYSDLGERLASSVELDPADASHGSATLIQWLRDDTVARATPLDFQDAFPVRATCKLAVVALALVALALVPLFGSDTYARFGRRLLLAWTPAVYGYELTVEPGDQYVGRGRSAVVKARVTTWDDGVRLPTSCSLIFHEGDSPPKRVRMEPTDDGTYTFTWPVVQDSLRYQVEAGDRTSATYRLDVVDPVALVPAGPTVQVTPPPYVQPDVIAAAEHAGHVPFTALQYSRIRFTFALDRPAHSATVRWRAGDQERVIALPLSDDHRQATWENLAVEVGPHTATLTLEAAHGIVSTYPLPAWSVWTDNAPWFSAAPVFGFASSDDRPKLVAPDDVISIKTVAEDQVGLGRVELEYRINAGPIETMLLADGEGRVRVETDLAWRLRGLCKIGDLVQCRLRLADNRRLAKEELRCEGQAAPECDLPPNVVYLPAREGKEERWWLLKIEPQAEPLAKQQVLAQRDELQKGIERIRKQLEQEREQVRKVKLSSHQMPVLTADQANTLSQARQLNQVNQQELRDLAQKAAAVPGLQCLAKLSFDIARRELDTSDQALVASQAKNQLADKREQELLKADQALTTALKRWDELHKANELFAQERLDVQNLEKLAQQEDDLAKQAEDLAKQPQASKAELERLRAEQAKIAARLQQWAEKNPRLQEAARQYRQARAQQLAKQAQHLAMNQRKLAEETEGKWRAELKAKFADLAQRQRELAGGVAKFGHDLKAQPATAPLESPHRPALDAADRLRAGEIEPALSHQQVAENALQTLSEQLHKTLVLSRDPRAAVEKLARLQGELLKKLEKIGDDFARIPAEQTRSRLTEITQGQKTLHDSVGKLEVPKSSAPVRQQVRDMTGGAADLLERKDTLSAFRKMEQARDTLQAWARSLPAPAAPSGKESPEELAVKKQADQARQLAQEQHELREATRKLLADLARKHRTMPQNAEQKESVDKLAQQLMELAQKADSEAKHAAQEAAAAAQGAQTAMAKSQADQEKGRMAEAKQSDAESALQLEMAGKKLDEAAQAMSAPMSAEPKKNPDDAALQKAFQDSQMKLDQAQQQLNQQPKNAATAMQQAAQALQQTAKQAGKSQSVTAQPKGGGSPAQVFQGGAPSDPTETLPDSLKSHAGKAWGELPGELRTRIVQDLRARYGDEYGPIIQRYFQQIADVPGAKK